MIYDISNRIYIYMIISSLSSDSDSLKGSLFKKSPRKVTRAFQMHPIPSLLAKKSPFCPGTNIPQEIPKRRRPWLCLCPGFWGGSWDEATLNVLVLQFLWVTLSYNRSLNQKKFTARNQLHCTSCKGTFWCNASLISPETSCDCPKSIKYTKKTRQSQPI